MTRIKQAGPPVLVVAIIAGVIGYIIGCTRAEREGQSEARAAQAETNGEQSPDSCHVRKGGEGRAV